MNNDLTGLFDRIQELVNSKNKAENQKWFEIDNRKYWVDSLKEIETEKFPSTLTFFSLQALADYLNEEVDGIKKGDCFIHINDENSISLYNQVTLENNRPLLAKCRLPLGLREFDFGQFLDSKNFIISLYSLFSEIGDIKELTQKVSSLTLEQSTIIQDQGSHAFKSTNKSIITGNETHIFNLAPYRTFREVDQPQSSFIFRTNEELKCGLWEADGGVWRIEAINRIKSWLTKNIEDITIIG